MQTLEIMIKPGKMAPRYNPRNTRELKVHAAVITEEGSSSGLPRVDLQMKDEEENDYFFAITGRFINSLSSAIKGVNQRLHNTEEL